MTMLLASPVPANVKPTTLTIKGQAYQVSEIDPCEEGTAAYRLDKQHRDGACYDVVRGHDGIIRCDCPSYLTTFDGTASPCKHGRALVEAGLLEAPKPTPKAAPIVEAKPANLPANLPEGAPAPSKPTLEPITKKDLVRAAYFKLALPSGVPLAVEVEATAPVVNKPVDKTGPMVLTPSPTEVNSSSTIVDLAPIVEPSNPRHSWPSWTDEVWTITPEPASDIDLTAFASQPTTVEVMASCDLTTNDAPHGMEWVALTPVVSVLKCSAPDHVSYRTPEPEPVEVISDRATYLPSFHPTAEDDAERLGFSLGYEGERANPPAGWAFPTLVRFFQGYLAGQAEREDEILSDLAWIAEREREAFADSFDRLHPTDLAEAGCSTGHPSFEEGGQS